MPVAESTRKQMHREVLWLMIDDVLMRKFLVSQGPRIDPAEVQKRMSGLNESLRRQGKSLKDFCQETAQTEAQVVANQTMMLQWTAYLKARVSDTDMKRYYDENRDFFDDVRVRASHILLRLPPGAPDSERQAARDKLLALRKEIIAGKLDFAVAASKTSHCPSAKDGGDLGFFPRKFVVEEAVARAAFALPVGQVSDLITTDLGLHLIKVSERQPGQPSEYEKVKDDVWTLCTEEMRLSLVNQLRKTARIQINLP